MALSLDGVQEGALLHVEYSDDDWLHARILVRKIDRLSGIFVTPHRDLYQEFLADWETFEQAGPQGGINTRYNKYRTGYSGPLAGRMVLFRGEDITAEFERCGKPVWEAWIPGMVVGMTQQLMISCFVL